MYQNDPQKVLTGTARFSYCHLTQPRKNERRPNDPPKYGVTLLIPKSDTVSKAQIDAAINAAIQAGVSSKWNGVRPPQPSVPVWDGDGVRQSGEKFGDECKGCWVITASSYDRPQVVDMNVQPIINESDIYSGMYGRAVVRFFAFANTGNKGIGCGLGNVQKIADGEPLGNRTSAADDFGAAPTVPGAAPSAPAYPQQPQYAPQPPQYGAPAAPAYPQQPQYAPQPAAYPQQVPQQPAPMPGYPQQPAINPVTGAPMSGPIMGIGQ